MPSDQELIVRGHRNEDGDVEPLDLRSHLKNTVGKGRRPGLPERCTPDYVRDAPRNSMPPWLSPSDE